MLTPSARPTAPPSECDTSNLPETPIPSGAALRPPPAVTPLFQFWLLLATWLVPLDVPCVVLVPEDEPCVSAAVCACPTVWLVPSAMLVEWLTPVVVEVLCPLVCAVDHDSPCVVACPQTSDTATLSLCA